MKYPKVLQILALASAITIAAPCVVIPSHASETGLTPQEYEAQYSYVLPSGYHYVLSNGQYVIFDENGAPQLEADAPAAPAEPETPVTPETPAEPAVPVQPETPAEPETPVEPETPEGPETPVEPGTPDGPETPETPENPDTPENPETPVEPETPTEPETPAEPETPEVPETPELPSGDEAINNGGGEEAVQPEIPGMQIEQAPAASQTETSAGAGNKEDREAESEPFFLTSAQFKAVHDRIQYNVDVPIEGLPSFITQEMVVGALKAQDETGYPASVTIAQIIQESGYGKYGPGGKDGKGLSYLAFEYCNLFGIKGVGTAGSVSMKTSEMEEDGSMYSTYAGFRAYHTYTECIEDRSELLEEVYSDLTKDVKDANTFAMKIGKRWATDLGYGKHLINTMRRYDLYRLDDMTLNEFSDLIGEFANPCPGSTITSLFGRRTAPIAGATTYHRGLDLGTGAYNIPTYAAKAGTVIFAGEAGACGNLVTIDHGDGLVTKYMHHAEIYVKEGDTVEKGQQIGLSGTTGNSTGNHLHFQVEEEGKAVDPLRYLQYDEDDQEIIKKRDLAPLELERQKEQEKQRMMAAAEKYGIKLPGWYQARYKF